MSFSRAVRFSKLEKLSERILEEPGKGLDNQAIGGHCDVVVNDEKAMYFISLIRQKKR